MTRRYVVDLHEFFPAAKGAQVLVTEFDSGEIEASARRTSTDVWLPVALAGGAVRTEHDEENA